MAKPLRVLIVEDSEDDALLVIREVERGGYETTFERVETAEAMTAALEKQAWDIIITDYKMPHFSAPEALDLFKETGLDLPFIVVSGTIGEETAVATMKAGAHDYLMKGNLTRLVPAIERELHEAEVRKERKRAGEALQIAEQNFRNSLDNSPLGIRIVTAEGELLYANQAVLDIYGYSSVEELKVMPTKQRYTPESYAEHQERKEKRKQGKPVPASYEISIVRKDREIRHLITSRKAVVWGGEVQYQVMYQDITERKRAEEALRVKDSSIASSINAVAIADLEGNLTYVNKSFLRMWGYDDEKEVLGKSAVEFWRVAEEAMEVMQIAMDRGGWVGELAARRKDGSIFDVQVSTSVVRDEAGKPICRFASFVDITERKQAEEELRQSEEHLRNIFETTHEGIITTGVDGRILSANPAAATILGYKSTEELVGRSASELSFSSEWRGLVFKESLATGYVETIEITLKKKDGTPVHILATANIYLDDKGNVEGTEAFFKDITERKQAEEEIKRAAEEWRTTFDSITDLVSICDKDFRLVRVNRAFADAFKMKPEELIGKPCYEIVHGTNEPVLNCPHKKTIKTKKPVTVEFLEPYLGIHLEVATSPIFNEKGEVVASVHLIRDVTERKKMEEQLIVTDRLASIGELASGIAHELNNPLTSVIGFSDLLLSKDLPDDVKEDLKVINREAQRTARVVRNLLTFARRHPQEKQSVDINNIIQTVLELRAYEQKVSNIQVNTQFAPDLPEITADGFQLQQVFLNIIINAEHFMIEAHGRGTLIITTERVGDIIRASFADDGSGIAKENLRHLFDPFFTTKEVGKGTGLGLSISYGIITEHGGRIYAESKLGKGATFVVELPVSQ